MELVQKKPMEQRWKMEIKQMEVGQMGRLPNLGTIGTRISRILEQS